MHTGQCHCGAIRYQVDGQPVYGALCHCADCRRHAGAPMVAWTAYPAETLTVLAGTPKVYVSSENGRRHFCADCGTGLFYYNEVALPGLADIQTATLDQPDEVAPQIQVQVAERLRWMEGAHELPAHARYPHAK
jgi:hypothetical protein